MFLCVWMFHSGRGRIRTCVTEFRLDSAFAYCYRVSVNTSSRPKVKWTELEWGVIVRRCDLKYLTHICLYCLSLHRASRRAFNPLPDYFTSESVWLSRWSNDLSVPAPIVSCFSLSSPRFMYCGTEFLAYYLHLYHLLVGDDRYVTVLLYGWAINAGIVTELYSTDWYYIITFTFFHTFILSIKRRI